MDPVTASCIHNSVLGSVNIVLLLTLKHACIPLVRRITNIICPSQNETPQRSDLKSHRDRSHCRTAVDYTHNIEQGLRKSNSPTRQPANRLQRITANKGTKQVTTATHLRVLIHYNAPRRNSRHPPPAYSPKLHYSPRPLGPPAHQRLPHNPLRLPLLPSERLAKTTARPSAPSRDSLAAT